MQYVIKSLIVPPFRLSCTLVSATQLAAYVVQAELGDYDPKIHTTGYISELRLVPNQVHSYMLY